MKAGFSIVGLLSTVSSEPKRPRYPGAIDVDSTGSYIPTYVDRANDIRNDVAEPIDPTRTSTQTLDITAD